MNVNIPALIVIIIYLILSTSLIIYNGRKVKTFKDFAIGGGTMPWYVIAVTMAVAVVGGGVMMGYVGDFYSVGLMFFWMPISLFVSWLIMAFFISARVRRLNVFTMADIFSNRFGENTRVIAGLINVIAGVGVSFAMLNSFASFLASFVGIPLLTGRIAGAVIFVLSTTLGGFKGIAWICLMQSVFLFGGAIVVGIASIFRAGGFAAIAAGLPGDFLSMTQFSTAPGGDLYAPMIFLGMVVSAAAIGLADQAVMFQRINAAKSPEDAAKATKIFAFFTFLVFFFILAIGLSARVVLGFDPTLGRNAVIGEFLLTLNPVFSLTYAAAIVCAVVTTANAMYLSAGMTFSRDLVSRFKPNLPDKTLLNISRLFIVCAAIVGVVVTNFSPVIMRWTLFVYVCIFCLIIPLYGGLLSKRATPTSGFLSLLFSIVGVLVWDGFGPFFGIHAAFVALVLGLLGFFIGFAFKNGVTEDQLKMVDAFKGKVQVT